MKPSLFTSTSLKTLSLILSISSARSRMSSSGSPATYIFSNSLMNKALTSSWSHKPLESTSCNMKKVFGSNSCCIWSCSCQTSSSCALWPGSCSFSCFLCFSSISCKLAFEKTPKLSNSYLELLLQLFSLFAVRVVQLILFVIFFLQLVLFELFTPLPVRLNQICRRLSNKFL